MKLIGISQRVCLDDRTGERRDCLAHDWYPFLNAARIQWIALPNLRNEAVALATVLDLQGILLTGGDDIGVFPERDETGIALLEWSCKAKVPVLGICRGMQVINHWLGGTLVQADSEIHRAKRHGVQFTNGLRKIVNSYHNYSISYDKGFSFCPTGFCEIDGGIEAAHYGLLQGIMWHPEREVQPQDDDIQFFRTLFGVL